MATINLPAGDSLQAAINAANPGDTINLQGNPQSEEVTVNKSLTINGNGYTLDGGFNHPNATNGGNTVNMTCEGQKVVQPWAYNGLVKVEAHDVHFDGLNITRSIGRGIMFGDGVTTYTVGTFRNGKVYNNRLSNFWSQLWNGLTIEDSESYLAGVKLTGARSPNNSIGENWPVSNLMFESTGVVLRRCKIYNNWGEGVGITRCRQQSGNNKIEDCDIWDNFAAQIYVHYSVGLEIINNRIWYSDDDTFWRGCTTATPAIWFNNEDTFIAQGFQTNKDIRISGNIIFGTEENIRFGGSQSSSGVLNENIEISYNTILDPQTGSGLQLQGNGSAVGDYQDVLIHNNIFIGGGTNINSGMTGFTFRDNSWDVAPQAIAQGPGDSYGAIALTNPDTDLGPNDVVNPANFMPMQGDPVIGAGTFPFPPEDDQLGSTRWVAGLADRGAIVYNPAVNNVPPVINNGDVYSVAGEVSQVVNINVTDADGNLDSCDVSGLPPGINYQFGSMAGIPTTPGVYTVTIHCWDLDGADDTDTFVWHVADPSTPRVMIKPPGYC